MTSPTDTPRARAHARFFQVGYTYRHIKGLHGNERFLVEHIAVPPEEFQNSPGEPGTGEAPVAFGWINAIKGNGSEIHFGAYYLDDFTSWEVDPDVEPRPPFNERIRPSTAMHVLWHFGAGGYPPGSFTQALMVTFACGDPASAARLTMAFPELGRAMHMAQNTETGVHELQRIANGS